MKAPELAGTLGNPDLYTIDRPLLPESQIIMDSVRHENIEALRSKDTPPFKVFNNHHLSLLTAQEMRLALNTFDPIGEDYSQQDVSLLNFSVFSAAESIQKNHDQIDLTISGAAVFGMEAGEGVRFVALLLDRGATRQAARDRKVALKGVRTLLDPNSVWPNFDWCPHLSIARTRNKEMANLIKERALKALRGKKLILGEPRVVARDYDRSKAGNEEEPEKRELAAAAQTIQ